MMTANHLKTGREPSPKTLCISNIPQTKDDVQHNTHILNILKRVVGSIPTTTTNIKIVITEVAV